MTSYQSRLGAEEGIAEELAESQRSISIAEFFEKNRHMLGFDSGARGLVTAVKEGVDNSLTWSTPFVYRDGDETIHRPIGEAIDELIEDNREAVVTKRGGDLEKLSVDGLEALSFDDAYDVDFQRISSVFRHRVNSDIFRITVEGGREVELTDYHSVFVLRDGEVVSVETSDIDEDDYVVLPDTAWSGANVDRLDFVSELAQLSPDRTEAIGLYGVEQLIDEHYDAIRRQVDAQYRMSDFRKCDRLPFNIVRELDLDPEAYEDCEISYRYGRNNVPAVVPVDEQLAELLGVYAAEGCVTGEDHEKVYLSLGTHESTLIARTERLVRSVFDVSPSTVAAHETATNVTIPSKIVGLLFAEVFDAGTGASEKRVPRYVFDFSRDLRERFLLGYAAGDGYPTESVIETLEQEGGIDDIPEDRLVLSTSSDRLSSGLQYLLSSIGYDATHERVDAGTRTIQGHSIEFGDSHKLYVHTDQSAVSRRRLPADEVVSSVEDAKLAYNLDRRQDRVDTEHALALADGGSLQFTGNGRAIAGSDLTALPVDSVERIKYNREWVYDVSVPGDENFMAGTSPLACHNSLDAAEEAGILPDVYVEIQKDRDYYTVIIEDNGPGITKEQIPKIFGKLLYGSRFHTREQSLTPDQEILVRRDGTVETIPIGRLADAFLPQDGAAAGRVPGGIEVPSFNRETHELTWQPVTRVTRHETDGATYEVTTEKNRTVEVTGDHSVFSVTARGETEEVAVRDLEAGDWLLAPRSLPGPENPTTEINLLEWLPAGELADRRVYVYGFDRALLERIRDGETVRKRPGPESTRKRTYYRYNGVEILKDSFESNYIEDGYLPAETVRKLGWEEIAAEHSCVLRSDQVGGDQTEIPVSLPVTEELMELLGYYVAEGHAGARQAGLTFGSHETDLVATTERAAAVAGGSTTTVEPERNSTRVKLSGSPLVLFLKQACGAVAAEKRVPEFVFEVSARHQRQFLRAVYEGDESDIHPSNQLSHSTVSERLARQLSVLWNTQGVLASTESLESTDGYSDGTQTRYRTSVYGADATVLDGFDQPGDPGKQQYKRIPTALVDDVRVGETDAETVPDSIPGLLYGAGVGASVEHAEAYRELIERALEGERIAPGESRYAANMAEMGLLEGGEPTDRLSELWETIQQLQGLTETDMCLLSVTDVTETEPPEYVYDISVPGATGADENFVVANDGALAVKNTRGQQGIGISAAVLYAQLTSGKPAKITSRTQSSDQAQYFELIVDTDTNEPEISAEQATEWDRPHGTRIELEMEANMRARQQLHEYIRNTAVVNPHARVELREPETQLKYERATDQLPAETEEIRPHPHGVELGTLIKMAEETDSYSVSGFLQGEFTRVGQKTAESIVDGFRDRHYGRAMSWRPPADHEPGIEPAVEEAVANKGAEATADFAERVADRLTDRERIAHHHVEKAVDDAGDAVQTEYGTTFGTTVRDNAVAAAWEQITGQRQSDLYVLVDAATTTRKDDAAIQGLAERLAAKFEPGDRHRVTRDRLREYVDRAADMTEDRDDATFGDTARENVLEELWTAASRVPDDPPRVRAVAEDRDTASELLEAMRAADVIAPPTNCLAPITEELVEAGLKKVYDADFYAAATRDAAVHGGDPFIVEAGIAYGGELEKGTADVLRFANRVPLVYQRGACATTDVIKGIGWRNYELDQPGGSGLPQGPAVVMVHVASTNVPFTSESKDAIANVPEIEHEIELAVREAARELKSFLKERRSRQQRREKQDKLATILPAMAEKLAGVTGREQLDIDATLARIMGDVLVTRERNGSIRLTVENNTDTNADPELTEIVTAEPTVETDAATVVEMDGEWFIQWAPTVEPGERATLVYQLAEGGEATVSIDGVDEEQLTIDTGDRDRNQ